MHVANVVSLYTSNLVCHGSEQGVRRRPWSYAGRSGPPSLREVQQLSARFVLLFILRPRRA